MKNIDRAIDALISELGNTIPLETVGRIQAALGQLTPLTMKKNPAAIDWSDPDILKKLKRRDGKHDFCRVLCFDAPSELPVKVMSDDGMYVYGYTLDGLHRPGQHSGCDLVPIASKTVRRVVFAQHPSPLFTKFSGTIQPIISTVPWDGGKPLTIEYEVIE